MSNKKSLIGLLIALLICAFSVLWYKFFLENKDEFLLDNPTSEKITVVLNGKKYILGSGQTLSVSIKKGKNTISSIAENGTILLQDTTINIQNFTRGLINPARANYYTFRRYYGHIKNLDSLYKAHKTYIGGKLYVGEIKKYNTVLIQDFYLNINQKYPKIINKTDSIGSRVKLFRENQFLDFYQKSFE
ncbi:hypothetical protein [Apibacter adventoris]|uniref:hypothetical protein n=1 Tax=Apibacter adventoris TaxID=1679466 RepID=UPI000CF71CDA|nr:hypothetical protein [Apibacter adventoris]PQL95828.1 hypothetical protein C4S76_01315 [Apibacter adventoris]